jgi:hypothetical protein
MRIRTCGEVGKPAHSPPRSAMRRLLLNFADMFEEVGAC